MPHTHIHIKRDVEAHAIPSLDELLKVTYLIYNTLVLFHLLLLKAFNFYGRKALSKLCLVQERMLVFKGVVKEGIEQSEIKYFGT